MMRAGTTLALTAAIAVLWGPPAVDGNTSRSAMMAKRRAQASSDSVPVAGVTVYPVPEDGYSAAGADELVSSDVADEVTEKLEEDGQVTGEAHGFRLIGGWNIPLLTAQLYPIFYLWPARTGVGRGARSIWNTGENRLHYSLSIGDVG